MQIRRKFPKDASYSLKRAEEKRAVLQIAFSYVKKRFGDLGGPQDTSPRKCVSASNPKRAEEKRTVLQIAFSYVKKRFGDSKQPQDTTSRKYVSASNPKCAEEKYAVL